MGAIADFDRVRFGGPTVQSEFSVLVGTTATQLLPDDPDRVAVYMTNNDAGPVYWSTNPKLTVVGSFSVGTGICTIFQVQNDGVLAGTRLYGIAPAGPFTLNILTLRRQNRG